MCRRQPWLIARHCQRIRDACLLNARGKRHNPHWFTFYRDLNSQLLPACDEARVGFVRPSIGKPHLPLGERDNIENIGPSASKFERHYIARCVRLGMRKPVGIEQERRLNFTLDPRGDL